MKKIIAIILGTIGLVTVTAHAQSVSEVINPDPVAQVIPIKKLSLTFPYIIEQGGLHYYTSSYSADPNIAGCVDFSNVVLCGAYSITAISKDEITAVNKVSSKLSNISVSTSLAQQTLKLKQ